MTMHLSLIDRPAGTFRWASAGHDPALIYRASQKIFEEVDGGGLPLGIDDDATYGETEIHGLTVGDVITIGTDGVWEMPNEQADQFGKDRLRAVIQRHAGESAATMKERLMADLNQFRGAARQVDDVTFAIIKVVATA